MFYPGGQKARGNLARAIYKDADIYLLDDPLSAVDAHVGKHLFEECIKKFLEDKVVILVTHQIQYLKEADNILVLQQGKVTHQGNYESILNSCKEEISSFLNEEKETESEMKDDSETTESEDSEKNNPEITDEKTSLMETSNSEKGGPKGSEELSKTGTVSKDVYFGYFKAGANLCTGFIVIFATICTHSLYSLSDLWIARWTNSEDAQLDEYNHLLHNSSDSNSTLQENYHELEASNQFNLMIYGLLILGLIVFCSIQTIQYYLVCMTASRNLHNAMFEKLLRAQPRFFDVNPSGRILNRFSKDMGSMDEVLPASMLDVKWVRYHSI